MIHYIVETAVASQSSLHFKTAAAAIIYPPKIPIARSFTTAKVGGGGGGGGTKANTNLSFRDLLREESLLAKVGYLDLKRTTGFKAYKTHWCALSRRDAVLYAFPFKSGSSADRMLKAKHAWDLGSGDFAVKRVTADGKEIADGEGGKKSRYFQLEDRRGGHGEGGQQSVRHFQAHFCRSQPPKLANVLMGK